MRWATTVALLFLISRSPLHGAQSDNSADIAVIDRVLATAKAGEKYVKFGDVGISVVNLQTFRARLNGASQTTELRNDGANAKQGVATTASRMQAAGTVASTVSGSGKLAASPTGQGGPLPQADTPNGTTFKWPGGNVYYRFDPTQVGNGTITTAKMQQFRDAVAEWAAFANLHFIENITGQPNFVTVQESGGAGEGGFSSSVGMAGGEQFLQFSPTAWNRGTICHEVGHALGFYHEQQRDDRDTYVMINFANMNVGSQANFTKLPGGSVAQGPYDFFSVMHYARKALSNNGQDTISMQPAYAQFLNIIGAVPDRTLSKLDRAGMAAVYGTASPAPGSLVTNTNDSGPGSLRSAIYYAFDLSPASSPAPVSPTPTTISFNIPNSDPNFSGGVFTIKPTAVMTAPGDGTTIDATTQTGFTGDTNANGPEVVLDGTKQAQYEFAGIFGPAFILRQANCVVKGFVIREFDQQGIRVTSDAASGSVGTGNAISGCYIGTDAAGTTGVGNGSGWPGIEIAGGANHNTIGGTTGAARNLISGGAGYGVVLHESGTNNNTVQGNYIGTNANGSGALANAFAGVNVYGGAQGNVIGGTVAGAGNIISGNKNQGILITDTGTNGNSVQGNFVGLNAAGTAALPNGNFDLAHDIFYEAIGVTSGAQNNLIGGSTAGAGNVISGNVGPGILISQANTNGTMVQGNLIGTNPAGTAAIGNGFADVPNNFRFPAVEVFGGAQSTAIGGTASGAGNLVSGNAAQGIFLSDTGTTGTTIQGNNIGLNATGSATLGNGFSGIGIFTGASSNTVGGTSAAARNVISGNLIQGILLSGTGVNQNVIQGNFIGTDLSGIAARPNGSSGVAIFGAAQSNTVGGSSEGARNIISGNAADGLIVSGTGTNSNNVQGNFIGLTMPGTGTLANGGPGLTISGGASNNTVGGTSAGARNYVCGNNGGGIFLVTAGTAGNVIQGNSIGQNFAGVAAGNSNRGITLSTGAQSNMIGGAGNGAPNIITASGAEGVALLDSSDNKDAVSRNSIFANGGKGIALFNGSNNSQAAPVLSAAPVLGAIGNLSGTNVSGSLTAAANSSYTIEYFASPTADPSGFGEGQYLLGSASVTTNGGGSVNFSTSLAVAVPAGYFVAATATDALGNTSEFSANQTVVTSDADSDGVPDNWTNAFFGHATGQAGDKSRASDDADGDGLTNLQEFLAGLDPKNANSALRITSVARSGSNVLISFPSVTGKIYQLQFRDDLVSGTWNPLIDGVVGTGAAVQLTDASSTGLTKCFYRIALEP